VSDPYRLTSLDKYNLTVRRGAAERRLFSFLLFPEELIDSHRIAERGTLGILAGLFNLSVRPSQGLYKGLRNGPLYIEMEPPSCSLAAVCCCFRCCWNYLVWWNPNLILWSHSLSVDRGQEINPFKS